MRTGDKLLFIGKSFYSWIILILGKFSHVGTAIYSSDLSKQTQIAFNMKPDTWYIFESTSISNVPDVFERKFAGVQLALLSEKVEKYNGTVWHKGLNKPLTPTMVEQLEQIIRSFYGVGYEKSKLALVMAQLDYTDFELKEDLTTIFCSELDALIFRTLGLLKGKKLNEFTPTDFGKMGRLLLGYALSKTRKLSEVFK